MFKSNNVKYILFPVFVVVLLAVILSIVFAKGHPKTPATVEKVYSTLEKNNLVAADLTNDYQERWKIGNTLENAVGSKDNDLRFDFFVFDSNKSAESIRRQYQSYILENRYSIPNIEISEGSSNYMLYTIKANGLYTINMRVANTLIFAYCDEENASKLNAIMKEIGYFDE